MSEWDVYPYQVIKSVAEKHGYDIGKFLLDLASGQLPDEILAELQESEAEDVRLD